MTSGASQKISGISGPNPVGLPLAAIGVATKWFVWLTLWYSTGGRYWLYLFRNTIRRDAR